MKYNKTVPNDSMRNTQGRARLEAWAQAYGIKLRTACIMWLQKGELEAKK